MGTGGRIGSFTAAELEPSCVLSRTGLEPLCPGDPARGVLPCLLASSGMVGTVASMCSCEAEHGEPLTALALLHQLKRSLLSAHPMEQALSVLHHHCLQERGKFQNNHKGVRGRQLSVPARRGARDSPKSGGENP